MPAAPAAAKTKTTRKTAKAAKAENAAEPAAETPARKGLGTAIKVQDLHVHYRTSSEKVPTLKTSLSRAVKGRRREITVVQALKGVSFEVPHGSVLGVVGSNGAGKSTLLRAISGILPPTKGRIEVHGKVSTLLALGVGFNQNLSGRENIILGGLAQGWSRAEVEAKAKEVEDFADLESLSPGAITKPMKTYSSGMYARVGFSVGVHMDPDILLVDEALSAGDAKFKEKAQQKMEEMCANARTIVLVSHGLESVRQMATHCLWLDHGNLMRQGDPDEVIEAYLHFQKVGPSALARDDV